MEADNSAGKDADGMDPTPDMEPECRVCRSGAEEGRPLFHPCKCSGSIKFIHQDCLLEWIKFSNQSQPKCELCGEQFSFTPVYKEGAPQQLPLQEFIAEMIPHAGDAVRRSLRISLLAFLWVVVLPVATSYAIDICNVFVFQETLRLEFTTAELWHAFWNGLLECILLIGLSTAVGHVWDGILRDARANHEQEAEGGQQDGELPEGVIELFGRQWVPFDLGQEVGVDTNEVDDRGEREEDQAGETEQQEHRAGEEQDEGEEAAAAIVTAADLAEPEEPHVGGEDAAGAGTAAAAADGQDEAPAMNPQPPADQPNDLLILPWEDDAHEIDDTWINELFDLDRPITRSIARWLRMCLYNIAFILAFEVCPVQVGRTILANMGITLADVIVPIQADELQAADNSTQSDEELDIGVAPAEKLNVVMVHEYVTRRAFAGVCGAIGYGLIVFTLLAAYCTYIAVQCTVDERFRRRHIRRALSILSSVLKWYKVASMVFIKAILIPLFMGMVLNVVTLKTCNTTLEDRVLRCQQMPLICGMMHWVVGVCFVLHVTSCTTELRKILRSDILAGVLPVELDPAANLIDALADQPVSHFVQQCCFNVCFYVLAVLLCVFLPARLGHIFVPFAGPLHLRFEGLFLEIQLPFELLLSHVVLPLALERVNYRAVIGSIERAFLSASCAVLGLEDLLEPVEEGHHAARVVAPNPAPAPAPADTADDDASTNAAETDARTSGSAPTPWWHRPRDIITTYMGYPLRYLLLVVWTLFATVVAFSWMIRLPLALGRKSLSLLHLPDGQDFYNYTVGIALLGAANLALHYVWRECLAQPGFVAAVRTSVKWLWLLAKVVTLAVLWLTVIPLMLGVIFELVLVIPLRLPVDETPKLPFAQCWALGLVSLKIWVRLVMLGAFGDTLWKRRFDRVRQNGVTNVQFWETFRDVFIPMFMGIGDYLFVPYLVGKLSAAYFFHSVPMASRLFRYSFAFYMAMRLMLELAELVIGQVRRLHDQIRDSRYLLGVELSNRATGHAPQPEAVH